MWLEIGIGVILLVALLQAVLLVQMRCQLHQLQQRVDALLHGATLASTDVPTSMLVAALGRLERHLGSVEPAPTRARPSYELAQQLARDGADVEHLMTRCGLSRDEASLIRQLYPASH